MICISSDYNLKMLKPKHKYSFIQSWGLIPLLIAILIDHFSDNACLWIGIVGGIFFVGNTILFFLRGKFFPVLVPTSLALIEFAFLFSVFHLSLGNFSKALIGGGFLFLNFLVGYIFKEPIKNFVYKWYSGHKEQEWINIIMYEFCYVSVCILYVVSAYMAFIILSYTYYGRIPDFVSVDLPIILIICFFMYEYIRMMLVHRIFSKEVWLPAVNEQGGIVGQVRRDESFSDTDTPYLHPHVRIVILVKDKIFLSFNEDPYTLCGKNSMDHILTGDLFYGESVEDCANRLMQEKIGKRLELRSLLKVPFTWEKRKRLVFLFLAFLDTDDVLKNISIKEGRLWSIPEIREYLSTGKFSECLVEELDFLEKIVIPPYNSKR